MTDREDMATDPAGGDDRALAAEYVLGLLSEAETAAFEARLAAEPALEAEVVTWTEYFASLAGEVPETVPPAGLRRRIEARAFGAPAEDRRPFWRMLVPYGLGGVAAALVVWAALTFGILNMGGAEPLYVADASVTGGDLVVHIGYFEDAGELLVIREAGEVPAGSDIELWLIQGEAAPVSLGLLPQVEDRVRYDMPADLAALLPGATFAISQEPPGGSPLGTPTGPVLATAPVTPY
ncbi:anti-sigma factor [Roseivivax isoporae]|uniref:Regulator of SigK n=1 Tax=Roseivivax isoporae LMG 25204 TaxID=1449351 RepID=X7F8U1_9RHOB|nr:anti-sigma factor [Roseivivax isoporae]ETX29230.1 hypothetical protein RISW2_02140 [Roseivivax isoporae LMG 25204]